MTLIYPTVDRTIRIMLIPMQTYPVEDVSNSFFDKVIVITDTWRVVSRLHKGQTYSQCKTSAQQKQTTANLAS